MSPGPRQPARDDRVKGGLGPTETPAGRLVSQRPRPGPGSGLISSLTARPRPADVSALRDRLLRYVLTLLEVALGGSRLDDDAAGIFVRVSRDGGGGF